MPKHLTEMAIDKVSLVDKGANQRRFAVLKQEDAADPADATHVTDERSLVQKVIDAIDSKLQPVYIEKVTKTVDGKDYPASDFAYVPDPQKPSTWKLRLTSTPGGDPDPAIVGAAIAALGKGFRGNVVDIPSADRPAVIRKVRAAWKKAHPEAEDSDIPNVIKTEGEVEKAGRKISGKRLSAIKTAMHTLYDIVEEVEPGWWSPPDGSISKEADDMDEQELAKMVDERVAKAVTEAMTGEAFTEAISKAVGEAVAKAMPKPEPTPEPEKAEEPEAEDAITLDTVAEAVTELAKRMDAMGAGRRQSIDGQDGKVEKKRASLAGIL